VQVFFKDGSATAKVEVEYPIGHRRRRKDGIPLLVKKFQAALADPLPARPLLADRQCLRERRAAAAYEGV
jgi:2-methylcitrate dehydratase